MKAINLTEVLLYYDGVQVFAGRDAIGGHYVGVGIGPGIVTNRYMVTGADPELLRQFRGGRLDLRTLLLAAPAGEWFITVAKGGGDNLYLEPQPLPVAAADCLPGPNFTLEDGPIDDWALQQARERGNVVFEFSVEPPEAVTHRLRANTLGNILIRVQTVIKHAYASAVRDLPAGERGRYPADGYLLDVVAPAAPGSFRVLLEAANQPISQFFGADLTAGLQRLDAVFRSADAPEQAPELLKPYRGPLAAAYLNLIRYLAEKETGLNYSWAEPTAVAAQYGGISEATARKLAATLADFNPRRASRHYP